MHKIYNSKALSWLPATFATYLATGSSYKVFVGLAEVQMSENVQPVEHVKKQGHRQGQWLKEIGISCEDR